ncbi:MAG TPA: glutamine-hydrolyzing carbamoyl-phosphate synthase small subunit [Vitreimonas sp.]|uniref:glutamine-hydrolyzing carbamoyl-phosphate synthase small subunit n=1 Tax=Vitreimonas sp. TaxID=3069702 RepID=UPI002D23814A|nr:glutamine-hydrolyzing carbamoyl-phosphate synthase small subunit [Vitreimonas sp.]HYD88796.1 glutamine-hydrolyzing carbamoyl-phosphate synthase small subunit [Vitreimonas sp.]
MAKSTQSSAASNGVPTGALVLADGTVFLGEGLGAVGAADGEVCFNTSMTGYQEILTDPSYAAQIVAFTFPHIGNVGANNEDIESSSPAASAAARGAVFRARPTLPSNWRAEDDLDSWLKKRNVIALAGLDTRALTRRIREHGMPNAVIAHAPDGKFDLEKLHARAKAWHGLDGLDLAKEVTTAQSYVVNEGLWQWPLGVPEVNEPKFTVVVMDYGVKRNILRALGEIGARTIVLPATATAEEALAHKPDGILLSNGPGDPAATGVYAAPEIKKLVDSGKPVMGVCLGHQMLGLALGAKTMKMGQGHHGANHPVKDQSTGKVEIVSMNHGFAIDTATLPKGVKETHVSLFDGSNCGIELEGKPVFSVQYHPEASPGPQDSHYLFERFAKLMKKKSK